MTHDDFVAALQRLQQHAEQHAAEARSGVFLSEVDDGENRDRDRVREYCRRNGIPVPALLEIGKLGL